MPTFKYLAKDPTGRDIQGVVESGAVNQVVADLKKQGLNERISKKLQYRISKS